eukprot:TRINITY_DN114284_c0_g1_i1.p2 TRINITY_DN114284_c0_g1~~TRINITY_DN114284_c0_g1_i1.p2  ORF type:complete len:126 (+),score=22.28 TRINITY_DN114284_c0_g1_i1:30-380(+)
MRGLAAAAGRSVAQRALATSAMARSCSATPITPGTRNALSIAAASTAAQSSASASRAVRMPGASALRACSGGSGGGVLRGSTLGAIGGRIVHLHVEHGTMAVGDLLGLGEDDDEGR